MSKELSDLIRNIRKLTTRLEFAVMAGADEQETYDVSAIVAGIAGDAERVQRIVEGTDGK